MSADGFSLVTVLELESESDDDSESEFESELRNFATKETRFPETPTSVKVEGPLLMRAAAAFS